MPVLAQQDIFSFADSADLLIVFGHRGFNEMGATWEGFRKRFPGVEEIGEPFVSFNAKPFQYEPGRFIVTVAEERNYGMSDDLLCEILNRHLDWAQENRIHSVATNGITSINHGDDPIVSCQSNEKRARLIIEIAKSHERTSNLEITLASLTDIFVRNLKR